MYYRQLLVLSIMLCMSVLSADLADGGRTLGGLREAVYLQRRPTQTADPGPALRAGGPRHRQCSGRSPS